MKIIYVGGYTNKEISHFETYRNFVQKQLDENKKIIIVALAQDLGYFTPRIKELYKGAPFILDDDSTEIINWGDFDLIYILGGNSKKLKEGLIKFGFNPNKLSPEAVLIGDSAGANVLAKYYIGKTDDGDYTLEEGLNPQSNVLVLNHCDNSDKTPKEKIEYAKEASNKTATNLLLLNENESAVLENNNLIANKGNEY